ncbi:MAG: DMT family transporter [Clostridia bacterium]|nr:DMT family transporter [Clostridia bacterium]
MIGIIFSLIAGLFISLQGVFNTRVSDKIGIWETTTIVHASGLICAVFMMIAFGNGSIEKYSEVNKFYLLGGVFGVIIIFSVMKGISILGPTLSVSIILVTQLVMATLIDSFGLFENPQIKFDFTKPLGVVIMIIGIIIFKLKG